ncbi:hypothetical protein CSE45_2400 [Citreicella sp. SE45]|nr:hypothetical protein CSE45_2400 [Citreicella sp. SE45]
MPCPFPGRRWSTAGGWPARRSCVGLSCPPSGGIQRAG